MEKYKITWDTLNLKLNGYGVYDVVDYLEDYSCNILEVHGGSIIVNTDKTKEGLYQEIRRVFDIEIKLKDV